MFYNFHAPGPHLYIISPPLLSGPARVRIIDFIQYAMYYGIRVQCLIPFLYIDDCGKY